ncbi:MAG: hypothetical protein M1153_00035 [Patescibacteria group bacterium]|nr:hypothetical protein [Patescibacteria group bacterium]
MSILDNSSKDDIVVTQTRSPNGGVKGAEVSTRFAHYKVDVRESSTGQPEVWFRLESRDAFEVAMLGYNTTTNGPIVTLQRKRRLATDTPRTKVPGGYLWGSPEEDIPAKILRDCGVQLGFGDLIPLGHVIGHSEIITPIKLYYTFRWERVAEPRSGIEIFDVPLQKAVEMAIRHEVENDSSFSGLMRLYFLWKEGKLLNL